MSDNKVMLDLDSETLREMLAKRLYERFRSDAATVPWDKASGAWKASAYDHTDVHLDALRGLAADGLLVRG